MNDPRLAAATAVRLSTLDAADFPLRFGRLKALLMPSVAESTGVLSYGEVPTHLPFTPQRYFVVRDVPPGARRGGHAHRTLQQLLVCVHGECLVTFDEGETEGAITLDRADVGLHVPPLVWTAQSDHAPGTVLLVLASDRYDPSEYVHGTESDVWRIGG